MRNATKKLSVEVLEGRDVPAQWFSVALDSPPEGVHGESRLTVTDGGLEFIQDEVWADSPGDAVYIALVGSVTVGRYTYELLPETLSFNAVDHVPFLLVPTDDGFEVRLEDMTAEPGVCDWDYNDTTWNVSVSLYGAPTFPVTTPHDPISKGVFEGHIKKGTVTGAYSPPRAAVPAKPAAPPKPAMPAQPAQPPAIKIEASGGHAGTPYPKGTIETIPINVLRPTATDINGQPVAQDDLPIGQDGKGRIIITVETGSVPKPNPLPPNVDPVKDPHEISAIGKVVGIRSGTKAGAKNIPVKEVKINGEVVVITSVPDDVDKTQFPTGLTDAQLEKLINDAWDKAWSVFPTGWDEKKGTDTGSVVVTIDNPMYPQPHPMKVKIYWKRDVATNKVTITSAFPVL